MIRLRISYGKGVRGLRILLTLIRTILIYSIRETLFDSSFLVISGLKNRVDRSVENKKGFKKTFFSCDIPKKYGSVGSQKSYIHR